MNKLTNKGLNRFDNTCLYVCRYRMQWTILPVASSTAVRGSGECFLQEACAIDQKYCRQILHNPELKRSACKVLVYDSR